MAPDYNQMCYHPHLQKVGEGGHNTVGCDRKQELGSQAILDFNPTFAPKNLITSDKLINNSELQFPHLEKLEV